MFAQQLLSKFIFLLLVFAITTVFGDVVHGAKKGKDQAKDQYAIDEATLQSQVMSFADRFTSIMASEFPKYIALEPSKKNRYEVQRMVTYSVSQAYIIAAEDDPGVALLDVTAMVMLGRMIFEEEGTKRYFNRVLPIIKGLKWLKKTSSKLRRKCSQRPVKKPENYCQKVAEKQSGGVIFPFSSIQRFCSRSAGI